MLGRVIDLKDKVMELLTSTPDLRNSDNKLIATIWLEESKEDDSKFDLLMSLSSGKYTTPESITRVRRKIQEQCPELRGEVRIERERLAEEMRLGIHEV